MTPDDTSAATADRGPDQALPVASRAKDVVIGRVRGLRSIRGWSAAALAERCAEVGAPEMTANVIRNLESRARGVSVEQLFVFALALDVPPAYLLTPATASPADPADGALPEGSGPAAPPVPTSVAVTDTVVVSDAATVHRWITGVQPLPENRAELYREAAAEYRPASPEGMDTVASRMLGQFEKQAEQFVDGVRRDVRQLLDETADQVASADSPAAALAALEQARRRVAGP